VSLAARHPLRPRVNSSLFHLQGVSAWQLAKQTFNEIRAHDILGRAAQLAYYFFLALFPFLICVIASLSVFGSADKGRALLFGMFWRFLPPPAFQLVATTFNDILQSHGQLKMSVGVVASLWSASMGMGAVMDTLNAAYRLKETRSIFKQYGVAIALTVALTALLVVSMLVSVLGEHVVQDLPYGSLWALAWRILKWPLGLGLLLLALAVTYYFAPDVKARQWHWITPGALAAVSLMALVSIGLRVYVHYLTSASATYGSLGAVIVLLLTFYFCGFAVLSGGALNGVLQQLFDQQSKKGDGS
jgi:membrane protein